MHPIYQKIKHVVAYWSRVASEEEEWAHDELDWDIDD